VIKLRYQNGLFVPAGISTPSYFRRPAEDVFLALLDAMAAEGQNVSSKPRAGNFAPALFTKRSAKEREDYRRPDFERAMQALFQKRRIKIAPYGKPSHHLERLERNDEEGAS
jgi:hypothetical protein